MRVSDYRWINGAAALKEAGRLRDDGDMASRPRLVYRLDDAALFFEGVQERRDLCGYSATQTLTLRRPIWIPNATTNPNQPIAVNLWNDFVRLHMPCDQTQFQSFFTNSLLPLPGGINVDGGIASFDQYLADRIGAPDATLAYRTTPTLSSVRAESNALYDHNAFVIGHTGVGADAHVGDFVRTNIATTLDGQDYRGQLFYYQVENRVSPSQTTSWATNMSIDVWREGGKTSWDGDSVSMMGAVIYYSLSRTFYDESDDSGDVTTAYSMAAVNLTPRGDGHYTFAGTGDATQLRAVAMSMLPWHAVAYGYCEYSMYISSIYLIASFTPTATPSNRLRTS